MCKIKHCKIHIVGGPGSGKSFVAKELSARYNIPVFDLDDIFWDRNANSYDTRAPEQERDQALDNILENDSWIVEGIYYRWLSRAFDLADIIIILRTSRWLRHWRIHKRFLKRKLDMIPSKHETISDFWGLVKWNHKFDNDNMIRIKKFIEKYSDKTVECKDIPEIIKIIENT